MLNTRIFAASIAFAALFLGATPALAKKLKVGEPAPDFSMTTFDGKPISLKDLKGQVILINFWATWCAPCRTEMPILDSYYKAGKSYGMAAVAVTTENSVPVNKLGPLAAAMTIPLARHFHGDAYTESRAVPMSFIIDRKGILRYVNTGAFTLKALDEVVWPLLLEPGPDGVPLALPAGDRAH